MHLQIEGYEAPAPPISPPAAWEQLAPRYVTMERQARGLWSAVMALAWLALGVTIAVMFPRLSPYRVPSFSLWTVLAALHVAWGQYRPLLEYRHSSYRLDAEGIEIRRGVLWRSSISVPRSRVQHTDVSQGPFERHHGLGTVHVFTAGVSHAQISLPGLDHARAVEIRDSLLPRDGVVRS